tara:strand:- start:3110 stop:3781 length:672 start_codon:yes stop_codon:yes gene_type:complete
MFKKILDNFFIKQTISLIGIMYILLTYYTSRVTFSNQSKIDSLSKNNENFIYAFWHDQLLMCPFTWKNDLDILVLISKHKDGDIISRVISYLGFKTIRGSTNNPEKIKNKGGFIAAKKILSSLKKNICVGIAPDGPRGPRHEVAEGIINIARMSNKKIIPVALGFKSKWTLNTWDKFIVPKFFSSMKVSWGEPIEIQEEDNVKYQILLKKELDTLTESVNSFQ